MDNAIAMLLCYVTTRLGVVRFAPIFDLGTARTLVSRWNCKGACKTCGAKTSLLGALHTAMQAVPGRLDKRVEAVVTDDGRAYLYSNGEVFVPCRGCARERRATRIAGKVDMSKTCNAKCEGACGPSCECSCGGKNHGASVSL